MSQEGNLYSVKIHFPYATVSLDKQEHWQVERIKECQIGKAEGRGGPYIVWSGYNQTTEVLINPELVTYVEINEERPF